MAQQIKNLLAMQETQETGVQSLGRRSPEGGNGNPPVFSSEKSHGQKSLAGCSPWGCKESDTTEGL